MKVKISLVVVFATLVAVTCAFADGFNLVSWPLVVANDTIQAVMADSMGTGLQLTGGAGQDSSDLVKWFDASTSTWYTAYYNTTGGPPPTHNKWLGSLHYIQPDKGYWVVVRTFHPAVTLTMTGSVNTSVRNIPIEPGPSYNFVGSCFATSRALSGASGDDCGLLASGMKGCVSGDPNYDYVKWFDGSTNIWYSANYNTSCGPPPTHNLWQGRLSGTQTAGNPYFEPGNGYIIVVSTGNEWDLIQDDTWVYSAPSKGAKVEMGRKTRSVRREVSQQAYRDRSPSTNKSLDPNKAAEVKRTR